MARKMPSNITSIRLMTRDARSEFNRGENNHDSYRAISRFEKQGPQIFRLGDIVEAQVSFIGVPMKGDTVKMHSVLHSIALLDGRFSKVRQQGNREQDMMNSCLN
jgi:hypothetical protein